MKHVLAKGKALSNFAKKSSNAMTSLKKGCAEKNMKYTTIKNPNETRWNSKHTNLTSIIKLKPALLHLANTDTTGIWTGKLFTPSEWKLAEGAVKVLELPMYVTKVWEAEKTPTMNMVVSELYSMRSQLENFVAESSCR